MIYFNNSPANNQVSVSLQSFDSLDTPEPRVNPTLRGAHFCTYRDKCCGQSYTEACINTTITSW